MRNEKLTIGFPTIMMVCITAIVVTFIIFNPRTKPEVAKAEVVVTPQKFLTLPNWPCLDINGVMTPFMPEATFKQLTDVYELKYINVDLYATRVQIDGAIAKMKERQHAKRSKVDTGGVRGVPKEQREYGQAPDTGGQAKEEGNSEDYQPCQPDSHVEKRGSS